VNRHRHTPTNPARERRSRAFTLVETTVAVTVLGVLFTAIATVVVRFRSTESAVQERQQAIRLLENALEWTAAEVRRTGQPPDFEQLNTGDPSLRDARFTVQLGRPDAAGFSPVAVELTWINTSGERTAPISLTAWMPITGLSSSSGGQP
jgi:prepilin-type N-terminal cleavage/methylation domain-containing protein